MAYFSFVILEFSASFSFEIGWKEVGGAFCQSRAMGRGRGSIMPAWMTHGNIQAPGSNAPEEAAQQAPVISSVEEVRFATVKPGKVVGSWQGGWSPSEGVPLRRARPSLVLSPPLAGEYNWAKCATVELGKLAGSFESLRNARPSLVLSPP